MKRRNFTKGLFAAVALIALPATYIYKQVKKPMAVKAYAEFYDYDPNDPEDSNLPPLGMGLCYRPVGYKRDLTFKK